MSSTESSSLSIFTASILLFSTPMYPFSTPNTFIIALSPAITFLGDSNITLWSDVKKGSHSAPLIITVSIFLSGGGESFI